jgi:hypothetical protein
MASARANPPSLTPMPAAASAGTGRWDQLALARLRAGDWVHWTHAELFALERRTRGEGV